MNPTILFEDNDILVLNKPSGMTVNSADTTKDELTIQGWVEERFPLVFSGKQYTMESDQNTQSAQTKSVGTYNIEDEFYSRGGIVHRLDKETSGVLIIAKNPVSFGKLKEQFMGRTTEKVYQALAHGKVTPPEGEISAPVGRLPFNRMHFGVIAGGREAVTHYNVLGYYQAAFGKQKEILSLVELHPKTGRTHQIRVHLKYLNHPIVADPLYAGRKVGREDRKVLSRLFLHAVSLSFTHPTTGERMTINAPLPSELKIFLERLQKMENRG